MITFTNNVVGRAYGECLQQLQKNKYSLTSTNSLKQTVTRNTCSFLFYMLLPFRNIFDGGLSSSGSLFTFSAAFVVYSRIQKRVTKVDEHDFWDFLHCKYLGLILIGKPVFLKLILSIKNFSRKQERLYKKFSNIPRVFFRIAKQYFDTTKPKT